MHSDANVPRILTQDGVASVNTAEANQDLVSVADLIERYGCTTSWSHTLVDSKSNSATLIAQLPGEGNRRHFHADWDEWWYIIEGTWEWRVDDKTLTVRTGDVVFIERGRPHQIKAVGDRMAIRLAVSRYDVLHHYEQ